MIDSQPLPDTTPATADDPCGACGASSWCRHGEVRDICYRKAEGCIEQRTDRNGTPYYIHIRAERSHRRHSDTSPRSSHRSSAATSPSTEPPPAGNPGDQPSANSSDTPPLTAGKIEAAESSDLAAVYKKLLSLCSLSPSHRDALKKRGLCDAEINTRRYGTLPDKSSWIVNKLRDEFGDEKLLSIPGFVEKTNSTTGETFIAIASGPGLLVPCRNILGMTVAVKVRLDKPDGGGKYRYLSSARPGKGKRGPGAVQAVHLPYARRSSLPIGKAEVVRLTEGELKADIATALDETMPTISVPGVGNWRPVLPVLAKLQARVVHLAFDADAKTNPEVARHLIECFAGLTAAGFKVLIETWSGNCGTEVAI